MCRVPPLPTKMYHLKVAWALLMTTFFILGIILAARPLGTHNCITGSQWTKAKMDKGVHKCRICLCDNRFGWVCYLVNTPCTKTNQFKMLNSVAIDIQGSNILANITINQKSQFSNLLTTTTTERPTTTTVTTKIIAPLRGYMGDLIDKGSWDTYYNAYFPFKIDKKQYFYRHGIEGNEVKWIIQELTPAGRMGKQTYHGNWPLKENFLIALPFSFNEKQYFYAQYTNGSNWFIQELESGGQMGKRKGFGRTKENYSVCVQYTLSERWFIFCHCHGTKGFGIFELKANFQVNEIEKGKWLCQYGTAVILVKNNNAYLFLQRKTEKHHYIQDVNSKTGRLGNWSYIDVLQNIYETCFSYNNNKRTFLYCHSIKEGNGFVVVEVLANKRIGSVTDENDLDDFYPVMFPFVTSNGYFFYGHSRKKSWFIRALM